MGVDIDCKRIVVMTTAVILLILSVVSLIWGGGIIHMILCILVIIGSILGIVGTAQRRGDYIRYFEWTCWVLFVWGVIVIIVNLVNNQSIRYMGWDIAMTILLAVSAAFAHDLHGCCATIWV